SEKGVLPEGMKSLYDAPAGSVLIYDGGTYGHAEIRSNDGFVSDYFTKRARTGESGKPKGSSRRIIGIWIKPYCGAGHEI
ncbi:MAG: hypothetical protein KGQ59_11770, partial [Bdellovibrionales bacterium]|nr:hypothetical protein [Bdellovibrionales bacterium]